MSKPTKGITIKWLLTQLGIGGASCIALIWGNQSLENVVIWFLSLFSILAIVVNFGPSRHRERAVTYFISKNRYNVAVIIDVFISCVLVYFEHYFVATLVTISSFTGAVYLEKWSYTYKDYLSEKKEDERSMNERNNN